jgi:hypothetical protein
VCEVERLRKRVAELERAINLAFDADCELDEDGGLIEGEAAHVLEPYLTCEDDKPVNEPSILELLDAKRRQKDTTDRARTKTPRVGWGNSTR